MTSNGLHYLVFGTGAIGGTMGGLLAAHGQPVTFLDRPEVVERVQASGLSIRSGDVVHRVASPRMHADIAEALAERPDVIIFAVKSYDTARAVEDIRRGLAGATPPVVLCLQNGVDNEDVLRDALGAAQVMAGTVTTAIAIPAPGEIVIEKPRGLGVDATHPLAAQVMADLRAAGLNVVGYDSAAGMKWSKLITNLIANPTSAILDMTAGEVFAHPGLYRVEVQSLREALAVMRALDVPVVDLPGVPVRLLATALRWLPPALYKPYFTRQVAGGRGGKMPSFHVDLSRGRERSEIGWLHGAVARHGAAAGVPTPVNAALTAILERIVAERALWGAYRRQPDKLAREVLGSG